MRSYKEKPSLNWRNSSKKRKADFYSVFGFGDCAKEHVKMYSLFMNKT